ncbi:hydrolase [Sphaerisporangium melleum]|uniref:Hydrolase n=1 Tax=Sphaerisporangium melleum TaxID=321316 RepID=A0A917R345_9ACTN|nr:HAD-IA family hydrolase [Sphaerisporangium melleum]GGK85433.1 hydrolase [Sphaerisporangium melleum]GII70537.1 hydrolase [Sphaerisporangium melleum]
MTRLGARQDDRVAALRDVRAVLLDMDGTLVDSDAAVDRAWGAWAAMHGIPAEALTDDLRGHPGPYGVRRLLPHLTEPEQARAAQALLDLECADLDGVAPAAGAADLFGVLAGRRLPWAVVTGSGRRLAVSRLAAAGIDPPLLVTHDDVARGKPDPEGYLKAAAALGVPPDGCLVVEDSPPGFAAGVAAGMRVATLRGLPGELPISDLADLAALLHAAA